MSACIFIASDMPLVEVAPFQKYPLHINLDNGTYILNCEYHPIEKPRKSAGLR